VVDKEKNVASYPHRPSDYRLDPKENFLKAFVQDLKTDPAQGITEEELEVACDFAWRVILSRLIGQFSVSTWGEDPPHPLFEIWLLIASSVVIRMFGQSYGVNAAEQELTSSKWSKEADDMLERITDPQREGQRMWLTNTDGTIEEPRGKATIPVVMNIRDATFFPAKDTDLSHGMTVADSVEAFYKLYSHRAGTG